MPMHLCRALATLKKGWRKREMQRRQKMEVMKTRRQKSEKYEWSGQNMYRRRDTVNACSYVYPNEMCRARQASLFLSSVACIRIRI
mmetsp:Transcript_16150/g.40847  ORF Transcript_16150/g.40847 Transcript_16150/m.40847 type:complete len:86 (-) Transcript_16150:29-286(-)